MNSKQAMEDTIVVPFGKKVRSKVMLFEWFICGDLLFRDVLVCGVCESWSNRSEMCICMSNCLWSWHIRTSRGRAHMFFGLTSVKYSVFSEFQTSFFVLRTLLYTVYYVYQTVRCKLDCNLLLYITFTIKLYDLNIQGIKKIFRTARNRVSILLPLSQPFWNVKSLEADFVPNVIVFTTLIMPFYSKN